MEIVLYPCTLLTIHTQQPNHGNIREYKYQGGGQESAPAFTILITDVAQVHHEKTTY